MTPSEIHLTRKPIFTITRRRPNIRNDRSRRLERVLCRWPRRRPIALARLRPAGTGRPPDRPPLSRSACRCNRSPRRSGSFHSSGRTSSAYPVEVKRNRSNSYSLRLVSADFRCSAPLSTTLRFLNNTTAPGARLRSVIRRRPVPVNM